MGRQPHLAVLMTMGVHCALYYDRAGGEQHINGISAWCMYTPSTTPSKHLHRATGVIARSGSYCISAADLLCHTQCEGAVLTRTAAVQVKPWCCRNLHAPSLTLLPQHGISAVWDTGLWFVWPATLACKHQLVLKGLSRACISIKLLQSDHAATLYMITMLCSK